MTESKERNNKERNWKAFIYLAVLLVAIGFLIVLHGRLNASVDEDREDESSLSALEGTYEGEILVWGAYLPDSLGVTQRQITSVSEIDFSKNYILIFNDRSDGCDAGEEDYKNVYEAIKDSGCAFFYLGENFEPLEDAGFIPEPELLEDTDGSVGYVAVEKKHLNVLGTVKKTDADDDVLEILVDELEYFTRVDPAELESKYEK